MTEKKLGRRSATTAEKTKSHIMQVAVDLFASQGFQGVTLRSISDMAGVSHSLIRHHFGSKETIWREVVDALDNYLQGYITELILEISVDKHSHAQRLYLFLVRLCAFHLVHKQPIQILADAVKQTGNAMIDDFLRSREQFTAACKNLFEAYNREHSEHPLCLWEMKWQLLSHAHSAASLTPFLADTWPNAQSDDERLLKHWQLFNQQVARQLLIDATAMLQPSNLNEIIIARDCQVDNH